MNRLEQFYAAVGSDANDVIRRLGGSAALVERFLARFPADTSFQELNEALNSGAPETAFRAAHTLKGVCANLSLQNLFQKASAVTELLRGGDLENARLAFPELEKEYHFTIEKMKELGL